MADVAPARGRLLRGCMWLYLVGLCGVAAAMVLRGERFWVSAVLLYVPRLALLAPLLVLAPFGLRRAHRRRFAVQAAAATLVVVALMEPHVSFPRGGRAPLRLFSYNVWYGRRGMEAIAHEIEAADPDVVLFQALRPSVDQYFRAHLQGYQFQSNGEFFLASRFPITDVLEPPMRGELAPGFARYTLSSPLGPIDVINVHPMSPRPGLEEVHHQGGKRLLTGGPSSEAAERLEANSTLRERQVAGLADEAAHARHPVVIAGDTNLPGLSAIFRRHLSAYRDGFADAGTGFGYTFPARLPWMRIDRILSGPELRFTRFTVGGRGGSDHCPVWADLDRVQ